MMAEDVNRNKRYYPKDELKKEVDRYIANMVRENRSMGELNHPTTAEVDLERACHMVTDIWQEGNVFYGKSKVLSTPCGQIVSSLINDGVKVGMSSRALGQLTEESNGVNRVSDLKLVAVDCVSDPSCPKAFVNGIFSLDKDKHHEIKAKINHLVENTKSYQLVKSVLENKSRSVYQGKIYVDSKAQKTDGYQLSKAILVDETTEFNAKPELEIYADDVKCSHGSASGSLDENSIFYLMSRGLRYKEARELPWRIPPHHATVQVFCAAPPARR